jgi:hypothetical protein
MWQIFSLQTNDFGQWILFQCLKSDPLMELSLKQKMLRGRIN